MHIFVVFVHDLSENQLYFLEKWVMKKLWAFELINFLYVSIKYVIIILFYNINKQQYNDILIRNKITSIKVLHHNGIITLP